MDYYSKQISKLIEELSSLPGIGSKSAQRLAFHILNMPVEQVEELSSAIVDARKNVRYCKECFTLTDDELCPICKDSGCQKKYPLLQDLLHADRCRGVSNLQQQRTGSFHDYGGRNSPGSGSL